MLLKFVFSKKATKFEKNIHHRFDTYRLHTVKSTLKISSIFVAFFENTNFKNRNSISLDILLFGCQIIYRDVGMHGIIVFTQSEFLIAATRQVLHEYKKA